MDSRQVSRCHEFGLTGGVRYQAPYQSRPASPCRGRCCAQMESVILVPPERGERRTCWLPGGNRRRLETAANPWLEVRKQVLPPVAAPCRLLWNAGNRRAHNSRGGIQFWLREHWSS